ncbi:hypothetical protein [Oceanirhabdus sp. W0125-5]|nr:hypothetical protein [Oceanirhabdus sp. W0125-5]WBW97649.1 hypothetical protein OW730_02400 [Oceanirhabdus sp. W0125-5]
MLVSSLLSSEIFLEEFEAIVLPEGVTIDTSRAELPQEFTNCLEKS